MNIDSSLENASSSFLTLKEVLANIDSLYETFCSNLMTFIADAQAAEVSVNAPNINIDTKYGVDLCENIISELDSFVNNLSNIGNGINKALSDLGVDISDIKYGYSSSTDSSSRISLIDGAIKSGSTIAGFSYVVDSNTCITWYGGNEYSSYDDFVAKIKALYPDADIEKNLKVLIETNSSPIAWVDISELNYKSNSGNSGSFTSSPSNSNDKQGPTGVSTDGGSSGKVISSASPNSGTKQITGGYTVTCYEADGWHFNYSDSARGVASGTNQKEVHELYKSDGARYSDEGIAVLNVDGEDRYLIALSSKFGTVGDKVDVVMDDGTVVKCVIADAKSSGDSNYVEDGHMYSGEVSIMELEVNTQTARDHNYANPGTSSWPLPWNANQDIARIDNYGSII